jgi:hypothetical protein
VNATAGDFFFSLDAFLVRIVFIHRSALRLRSGSPGVLPPTAQESSVTTLNIRPQVLGYNAFCCAMQNRSPNRSAKRRFRRQPRRARQLPLILRIRGTVYGVQAHQQMMHSRSARVQMARRARVSSPGISKTTSFFFFAFSLSTKQPWAQIPSCSSESEVQIVQATRSGPKRAPDRVSLTNCRTNSCWSEDRVPCRRTDPECPLNR